MCKDKCLCDTEQKTMEGIFINYATDITVLPVAALAPIATIVALAAVIYIVVIAYSKSKAIDAKETIEAIDQKGLTKSLNNGLV